MTTYKLDFTLLKSGNMLVYAKFLNLRREDEIHKQVELIVDTSASKTIISQAVFFSLGYRRIKPRSYQMVETYGGYLKCYNFKIPSFNITDGLIVKEPIVWVPDNPDCMGDIFGQDVLKMYNYYVDNRAFCIYLEPNS